MLGSARRSQTPHARALFYRDVQGIGQVVSRGVDGSRAQGSATRYSRRMSCQSRREHWPECGTAAASDRVHEERQSLRVDKLAWQDRAASGTDVLHRLRDVSTCTALSPRYAVIWARHFPVELPHRCITRAE